MVYSYQVVKRGEGKCNQKSLSNCITPERMQTRRPLNGSDMMLMFVESVCQMLASAINSRASVGQKHQAV